MINNWRFLFYKNANKIFLYFFFALLFLQIFFWQKTQKIEPDYKIISEAPNLYLSRVATFGDEEFLFRLLTFNLQNSGDVFLKFTSLNNYNYQNIYNWLETLDRLNFKSNLAPSLAAYYFSQNNKKENKEYIVLYLEQHALKDINLKWWWLFQAINIASEDLKDLDLALKLANELSKNNAKDAPLWTKQMPAFIYAKQENGCMAFKVIEKILNENSQNSRQITVEEMNFMRYFIENRLRKLKNQNFDPKKCQKF